MPNGPTSRHDVVVVGARVAGAATAMLLARCGLDVLVVDRGTYRSDTLSTHALMRGGVLQLHRWGLVDRVAASTPAIRRTTFRYADDEVTIPVKSAHGVDALYAPRRTVLDGILVDAAREAGAEVRYGVRITDVVRRRKGAVTGVRGRGADGEPVHLGARLVIGADGIRSTIAARVHAPYERHGTGASATTYGYWSGIETDGYEWNFRPDASSGVIPTNHGQACVFASASPRRIGRGGVGVLTEIVAEASPELAARLAAGRPPEGMRTFLGHPGYVRRAWGPGWALVGDAGYYKDPQSSHGITDAMRDAELLARAVVAISRDGAAESETLAGFQSQRDELSAELFDVVDRIAGQRWTDAEIPSLLLRLSGAMFDEVELLAGLAPMDAAVHAGSW